jgi:hypothetical protein
MHDLRPAAVRAPSSGASSMRCRFAAHNQRRPRTGAGGIPNAGCHHQDCCLNRGAVSAAQMPRPRVTRTALLQLPIRNYLSSARQHLMCGPSTPRRRLRTQSPCGSTESHFGSAAAVHHLPRALVRAVVFHSPLYTPALAAAAASCSDESAPEHAGRNWQHNEEWQWNGALGISPSRQR